MSDTDEPASVPDLMANLERSVADAKDARTRHIPLDDPLPGIMGDRVVAAIEQIRGTLSRIERGVDAVDDLDELARIRLLLTDDLPRDIAAVVATVDTEIQKQVRLGEQADVLNGRILSVVNKTSGGSTHWNHRAAARAAYAAAIRLAEGDMDQALDIVADCLGKSAPWQKGKLRALDVSTGSLTETTAKITGTAIVITTRSILPQKPPPVDPP